MLQCPQRRVLPVAICHRDRQIHGDTTNNNSDALQASPLQG